MNKKMLLGIILVITSLLVLVILLLTCNTKYNKLIVDENKWNEIINSRSISTSISIEKMEFNDYNLLIDEESSSIYYSIVNVKNKYNPLIKYNLSNSNLKIAFNKELTDDVLEDSDIKIILYDDESYRIYSLVATNYSILNINYKSYDNKKIDIELEMFDNHVNSPNRVLKSDGELKVIEENKEYAFSLKKESIGRNKRENHVSIFGMEKRNEYLIKVSDIKNKDEKYVQFFINNKYKGLYTFTHNERRVDNFERNKENNR